MTGEKPVAAAGAPPAPDPQKTAPPGFTLLPRGDRTIVVRDDVAPVLARLMEMPFDDLRAIAGARVVSSGRAGPVHIPVPGSLQRAFVRPYGHGGVLGPSVRPGFASPDRAWLELAVNVRAVELDLPVIPLIGATATRRRDGRWDMEAWSFWQSDRITFSLCLPSLASSDAARHELLRAAGRAIRACHDAGLLHADLNARNIIVNRVPESWQVKLVDLDRARFVQGMERPVRLAQVRRLYRSLHKEGVIPDFLPVGDLPGFVRECVGGPLTDGEVDRFLAGCRRVVYWHDLFRRLLRRVMKAPGARAPG